MARGASMRDNNIARRAFTRHTHGWKMASLFTRVYKTPVKILRTSIVRREKSRERNVTGRFSLVLGFPVNKESGVSSVICIKCKSELEKLEMLENSLTKFRQKIFESAAAQRERGYAVERAKRCHTEKFPNHEESGEESACKEVGYMIAFSRKTKTPSNASNCLAELPFHEEIVIPVKPKKKTSTVEMRNYEINRRSITLFILLFLRLFELAFKLTLLAS